MSKGATALPSELEDGVWLDGSFLIERYVYANPNGTGGIQWLVHHVKNGAPSLMRVATTRREATEYVRDFRG